MKIAVNARLLTKPFTGIGQYTKNLFMELAKITPSNKYILVVPEKVDLDLGENVEIKVLPEKKVGSGGMRKTWWEQITVPEYFKKIGADIAVFTYPCNPWTGDFGIKSVVTVHDCIPWKDKRYRRGVLSSLYHSQSRKAVAKADIVLTVSETSKRDIEKVCGVPAGKIKVIYNDASAAYKSHYLKEETEAVLSRFNLKKGEFFLYVGGYDKRKNVDLLIKEYGLFIKKHLEEGGKLLPLVLAGGKLFDNKLYGHLRLSEMGNLIWTGFIEEKNLAILYQNCAAFVNLSEDEGFNIPIIEAANCKAPLVLSDISVHREIAGDSAIFVHGNGVEALEKVLKSSKNSSVLAEKYSWKSSAVKMKDVLFSMR